MTIDTEVHPNDALLATDPDAMIVWPDQDEIDALAALIAAWTPAFPFQDIEAMILSGDDGGTPYWFAPPADSAREAVLTGSEDADILHGREGADLLFGLEGDDILQDVRGNNLFDGGAGDDIIEGAGLSLYIGGTGNDTITAWGADFTLAFNAGDGFDTVVLCARGPATISLGLGIGASDLLFTRAGSDLIVTTGAAEGMALSGWYDNPAPEALALQLIGAGGVEHYDLMALSAAFSDRQGARLGQDGVEDSAPAGGELAAIYATSAAGIEITGASAALWTDAFGFMAGLGVML
ncbi:hypothetical protein F2P45_00890 [Massilia sp. CCM 8733]|uniref:Calcium-binding protein n=1 Tax=Massilia mucilaginosa TaxID=2609282 RepID=A0ABX0NLA9_9BURK|nr:calcium-binding protein [Massilia mucilaginosa]NHZ87595.1 hypothetical protein [Massilia mucilaginosa]